MPAQKIKNPYDRYRQDIAGLRSQNGQTSAASSGYMAGMNTAKNNASTGWFGKYIKGEWNPLMWIPNMMTGRNLAEEKALAANAARPVRPGHDLHQQAGYTRALSQERERTAKNIETRAAATMSTAGHALDGTDILLHINPLVRKLSGGKYQDYSQWATGKTTRENEAAAFAGLEDPAARRTLAMLNNTAYAVPAALSTMAITTATGNLGSGAVGKALPTATKMLTAYLHARPGSSALGKLRDNFENAGWEGLANTTDLAKSVWDYRTAWKASDIGIKGLSKFISGADKVKQLVNPEALRQMLPKAAPKGKLQKALQYAGDYAKKALPTAAAQPLLTAAKKFTGADPDNQLSYVDPLTHMVVDLADTGMRMASDTYDAVRTAGEIEPAYNSAMTQIRQQLETDPALAANPAELDKRLQAASDELTDGMFMAAHDNIANKLGIAPDSENLIPGARKAEYDFMMKRMEPGKRSELLYSEYSRLAKSGGHIPMQIFSDKNLTPEHRKQLYTDYLRASALTGESKTDLMKAMWDDDTRYKIVAHQMQVNPLARKATVTYGKSAVADMLAAKGGIEGMSPDDYRMIQSILPYLSDKERGQILDPLRGASAAECLRVCTGTGALPMDEKMIRTGTAIIRSNMKADPEFAAEFIPGYAEAVSEGAGISEAAQEAMEKLMEEMTPEELVSGIHDDSIFPLARWALSDKGKKYLERLGGDKASKYSAAFQKVFKDRMFDMVKEDPSLINQVASVWFKSKGWDRMSELATDPVMFYGVSLLLMGGSLWLGSGLFRDDEKHREQENGQEPMSDVFGWQTGSQGM